MKRLIVIFALFPFVYSCSTVSETILPMTGMSDGLNLFSIEDDIAFGQQLDGEILSNPEEYPILDPAENPEIYAYVGGVMDLILDSDEVKYKDDFPWQLRIIDADVLNAFAAPGGFLYFYTGFLTFCESEAEMAGVMAHEIAHADRRHSTEKMTETYGVEVLLSVLLGEDQGMLGQMVSDLSLGVGSATFTRENESDADDHAMEYLYSVRDVRNYNMLSMQDFFNRIETEFGESGTGSALDALMRSHPYNDDREAAMTKIWESYGSPDGEKFRERHAQMVAGL